MRIAVLGGGGAMGGLFGGYFAAAGHEVVLVDPSRPALEAIGAKGLAIEEKDGSVREVAVRATDDPGSVGIVDMILVYVKCYHTEAAIRSAKPMIGPKTVVVSLQNGWGNADRIGGVIGSAQLLVGLTYHSATLLEPGRIRHPGAGLTHIGELSGEMSPRLAQVVEAFGTAKLEAVATPRVRDEVWKKLALNVCTLPTAGLLGFTADALGQHDGTLALMRGLLDETVAVAQAQGIGLDADERWPAITGLLERAVGARASMLQDIEAQRRTEIDVINGAITEAGQRLGIATPLNNAMVWLVRSLEEAYLAPGAKAAA